MASMKLTNRSGGTPSPVESMTPVYDKIDPAKPEHTTCGYVELTKGMNLPFAMNLNVTEATEALTGRGLFSMLSNPAGLKAADIRALLMCALKEGSRILSQTGRPDPRLTLEWVGTFMSPVSGTSIINKIMTRHSHNADLESLAPYVPTPTRVVDNWLKANRPATPGTRTFLDLGCGMGILLSHMHGQGFVAHGYEVNEDRYYSAAGRLYESVSKYGHDGQVAKGDVVELLQKQDEELLANISAADVVWAYWLPATNEQYLPQVMQAMKPGAVLLSHNFRIPEHPRRGDVNTEVIEDDTTIHYLHSAIIS